MSTIAEAARRTLSQLTNRVHSLPVVVLMPHSACNCRCVMCDIWKANSQQQELSVELLSRHLDDLRRLRVRQVTLSGGEPLMHSNLWSFCRLLREADIRVTLLSTGLLLTAYAEPVAHWCDEVIVSLDGPPETHDRIRRVPRAFSRLEDGVGALRRISPDYRITARCVVQRANFRDLQRTVDTARALALDSISFLAADTTSEAFNRAGGWDEERAASVGLDLDESKELSRHIEELIAACGEHFTSGFIVESPAKLRSVAQHFLALQGAASLPVKDCNAPWVSTVVEADGTVRPCFFHRELGNLADDNLEAILNSSDAVEFRRTLDVATNEICRQCVCTLRVRPFSRL